MGFTSHNYTVFKKTSEPIFREFLTNVGLEMDNLPANPLTWSFWFYSEDRWREWVGIEIDKEIWDALGSGNSDSWGEVISAQESYQPLTTLDFQTWFRQFWGPEEHENERLMELGEIDGYIIGGMFARNGKTINRL